MAKTQKTYRELMQALDAVMQSLQADDLDVDAAITYYEKGIALANEIEEYLMKAENKLTTLRNAASK